MSAYIFSGYDVGDRVRAFHPRTLGVVYTGKVVTIGRKWITIDFGTMLGGLYRVTPADVVGWADS